MPNNIMPGEHDWMYRTQGGVMGFPSAPPPVAPQGGGGLLDKIAGGMGGLLGAPGAYGDMLPPEARKAMLMQALGTMGANLMSQSGWSPQKTSFGQALGNSILATQQQMGQQGQDMMQAMLLKSKLQKGSEVKRPSDVQSYEYAKDNGYTGSFAEWKRIGAAQPQQTSDVQNWEYFQKLNPEQQKQWLTMQRQPTAPQLAVINGVPTLVDRIQGTQTPLTTLQQEIGATTEKAGAEAEAKALGMAKGEAQGGLAKKGINAMNVLETIELADPLVDVATGSATGEAADKVASFFGKSTGGDQAIAQLKIIQANLMTNMPRMEGPQSDRDVQLYREAAGELGDPSVPRARKKAAISMIKALQQKYTEGMPVPASANRPPLSSFQK
jgi:hypothetical protein